MTKWWYQSEGGGKANQEEQPLMVEYQQMVGAGALVSPVI